MGSVIGETYRSEKRFDLIIMTGHAFQVSLSDDVFSRPSRRCGFSRTVVAHSNPDTRPSSEE